MVIVKLGLKGKSPDQKVTYGVQVKTKMTGNTYFPDAATVLSDLGTAAGALNSAIENPLSTAATIKEKELKFNVKLKAVVAHVQSVINEVSDDVALDMLSTTGLDPRRNGSVNIAVLSAKQGTEANSVIVRSKAQRKRVTYVFQICTSSPELEKSWTTVKISGKAKVVITGLISGTKYYFRVAIIRSDVQESFSDPISIIVE